MTSTSDLRRWFEHCAELPAAARTPWIEQHVPVHARERLHRLLAAEALRDDWIGQDVGERIARLQAGLEATSSAFIGRRCGAFRLVRELGQGGQGIVYLGERAAGDFDQPVAVKLLRRVILGEQDLRDFRRERDILLRFDHPGIARLIDGGINDDGMPYLVMDYLDGDALDAWCLRHAPTREQVLTLFAALCAIVAAAHRRLIVHRDLKPSNVLVMPDGSIRVLDFGIARLLDEDDGGARTQWRMLTPGYAAPELLAGDAATPASDVHALGLMLRQMLALDFGDPRRTQPPAGHTRALPRELRWIIDRATHAEPAQRYRDAEELGEDIARYRNRQPLRAHPPGRWYRLRKFVARHRVGVLGAGVLLLAAAIGFGMALWQARLARQQAHAAAQEAARATAVRGFVDRMFDAVRDGRARAAEPSLRELVAAAGNQLLRQAPADAEVAVDLATLFADLALASGDLDLAHRLADQAVRDADAQLATDARLRLTAHVLRGYVASKREDFALAAAELQPALAALDRHAVHGRVLLQALEGLQSVENMRGDRQAYIALARRDIAERRALGGSDAALGVGYNNLGSALEGIEDYAGARAAYAAALALARAQHGPDNADTAEAECGLASTQWRSGRWREALGLMRECNARYRSLQHAPTQPEVYALGKWCVLEGWMLGEHTAEACHRADVASDQVFAHDADYQGESHQRQASWMIERGVDYARAEALLVSARTLFGEGELNAMRRGRVDQLRAELLLARGAWAQVRRLLPGAIVNLRQRPFKMQPLLAQAQLLLACSRSPGPECPPDLRADIEHRQQELLPWRHPQMLQVQVLLARVDLPREPQAAVQRLLQAIPIAAEELPAAHPRLLEAQLWLALAQRRSGECAAAASRHAAADTAAAQAGLSGHPLLRVARSAWAAEPPCVPAAGS